MDIKLIKQLLPVLVEVIKGIKDISDNDVSNMTIAEIEDMLREAEWPEFDFDSTKE
jgi:lysozyme family protein